MPNISPSEQNALKKLKTDDNTYLPSDKGGEFTIISSQRYLELGLEHLSDNATYTRNSTNQTNKIATELQNIWYEIIAKRKLPNIQARRLIDKQYRTQQFYFLLKTHKQGTKIRPIVSASGGPFDRLGWLLQTIMRPILNHIPAHISSTEDLLSKLNLMTQTELLSLSPFSLDVVSMFTNVETEEEVKATTNMLIENKIDLRGFHINDIKVLLNFMLKNNFFEF